jgi:hypothetical protein
MIYPAAIAAAEDKTNISRLRSKRTSPRGRLGAKMYIEVRYWARIITKILYPLTTENKLKNFNMMCFCFLLNIKIK